MTTYQKEYLSILEKLEAASGDVRFDYTDTPSTGQLLAELKQADLINATFYIGPLADASITYKGRLELDRLRAMRPLHKFLTNAGSALFFATGMAFDKLLDFLGYILCKSN